MDYEELRALEALRRREADIEAALETELRPIDLASGRLFVRLPRYAWGPFDALVSEGILSPDDLIAGAYAGMPEMTFEEALANFVLAAKARFMT
jgi:hypothetical protein